MDTPARGISQLISADLPLHFETRPEGEKAAIESIERGIEKQVREAAKNAPARRDAHPKAHGCVAAEFKVLDHLPNALRVGLFDKPRTYRAWIRFSSGSPTPQDDAIGDGRGMAVKVMGVERSRSGTQDFIMINHPTFIVRNAVDYVDLQQNSDNLRRFFLPGWNPLKFRLHEALIASALLRKKVSNLLNIQYWSMTPYLLGDVACKYSARPAGPTSPFRDRSTPHFLRENLVRSLAQDHATFDFCVQLRSKESEQPIEDPTIEWQESASPFVPVARITIPRQTFDSPEQNAFAEGLSFTPWHGLDEHRPLGGINRVRRIVYETISRLRHELNGSQRNEPAPETTST